jgi:pimeloyl-ACP methyl ester carboxylesterase
MPKAGGRVPVVVLVQDWSTQTREWQGRRAVVLASELAALGLGVLAFDDRGAGASGGRKSDATLAELAADVRGFVELLRRREDVDPERVGLVGFGFGAVVALRASDGWRPAGVVLLAPWSNDPYEVLSRRVRPEGLFGDGQPLAPDDPAATWWRMTVVRAVRLAVETNMAPESIARDVLDSAVAPQRSDWDPQILAPQMAAFVQSVRQTPLTRDMYRHDPKALLEAVARSGVPVLTVSSDEPKAEWTTDSARLASAVEGRERCRSLVLEVTDNMTDIGGRGSGREWYVGQTLSPTVIEHVAAWMSGKGR